MNRQHLHATNISYSYPDRTVLADVDITATAGQPVALIGENGSGKTTLLHILAGKLTPDNGHVTTTGTLGLLHQHLPHSPTDTVNNIIETAVAPIRQLGQNLETWAAQLATNHDNTGEHVTEQYNKALTEAEHRGLWELDSRINETLAGLNLNHIPTNQLVTSLSGGQRTRLALAALLLSRPDILLLDEPTNHLDNLALDFLTHEINSWPGPVIFTSHDRTFINDVAHHIVDLDPTIGQYTAGQEIPGIQGTCYTGNYSDYLHVKEKAYATWCAEFVAQQEQLDDLEHIAQHRAHNIFHTTKPEVNSRATKKFLADKAAKTVGRRVKNAQKRIETLSAEQVSKPPKRLSLKGFTSTHKTATTLECLDVAVEGRLQPTSLTVPPQGRLLISGPNGSGKSTLLNILAGQLNPTQGTVRLPARSSRGLLAQDVTWHDPSQAVSEVAGECAIDLGLLNHRDLHRPVGSLSIGQQRRVALAKLVNNPPDVLLLDEPTNHLSLSLCEELERALQNYPGIVIVASHDRWLRTRWQGQEHTLQNHQQTQ